MNQNQYPSTPLSQDLANRFIGFDISKRVLAEVRPVTIILNKNQTE